MYLQRLYNENDGLLLEATSLYENAFPPIERRDADEQARVMKKDDFHFTLMMTEEGFAGIALYWETPDFIFLEHLAILPALRGKGYGSAALSLLKQTGKTVILEIEPPIDELTLRRRAFYERNGFQMTHHHHLQTRFRPDDSDLELKVLSYPHAINEAEYRQFYTYLQREVDCRAHRMERSF